MDDAENLSFHIEMQAVEHEEVIIEGLMMPHAKAYDILHNDEWSVHTSDIR